MNMHVLKRLWALMRREYWETRGRFFWVPVIMLGLTLVFVAFGLILGSRFDNEMAFTLDAIRSFALQPIEERRVFVAGSLFASTVLYFQIMVLLLLFYLSGCLYDDRKDRSILFWKSLPISDRLTVTSKVLTACVLAPAMYLAAVMVTHLALLMIASGYSLAAGVNPLTAFWLPAALPKLWLVMGLGLLVQALWLLPIYAWLVFCSSWAPRAPIMVAIGIPAGLSILQHFWSMISAFRLPDINIGLIILKRLGSGVLPTSVNIDVPSRNDHAAFADVQFSEEVFMSFSNLAAYMTRWDMWVGVVIAMVLFAAATWFRRRATDN